MRQRRCSGQSVIEFAALMLFVVVCAYIFFPQLRNAISGRARLAGDSLSFGMAYQPGKATSCSFEPKYNLWYTSDCYATHDCDKSCFSLMPPPVPNNGDPCQICLQQCSTGCQ